MSMIAKDNIMEIRRAPVYLEKRVLAAIDMAEEKRAKQHFIFSCVGLFLSLSLFVLASLWFYQDLNRSGFLSSFNLLFTDSALVISYWKDFGAMLIEAMPFISAAAFFGTIMAILFTSGFVIRYNHERHNHRTLKTNFA